MEKENRELEKIIAEVCWCRVQKGSWKPYHKRNLPGNECSRLGRGREGARSKDSVPGKIQYQEARALLGSGEPSAADVEHALQERGWAGAHGVHWAPGSAVTVRGVSDLG